MQETNDTTAAETAQPDPKALAVLPPPERAAVALGSAATEQHLRGLIAKTAEITNVVDANGRHEAHSAAMMLKNARVTVTNAGKTAREDAVAFQRAIIAEADRLAAITSDEETRLFKLRDDFDDKMAAEKAERERQEAARKAKIIAIIDSIRRLPAEYAGHDSTVLTELLKTMAQREVTEVEFSEFAAEARVAIDTTASALLTLREGALAREEAARQDAEARRLEAERIAAERAALAVQKAEQERIAAEQVATLAEIKRVQDEAEATARRLANERAEQRRQDEAAAEAERAKLEQAAAELEEQRAAFARERQEAIAAMARDRAAATVTVSPFDIDWDEPPAPPEPFRVVNVADYLASGQSSDIEILPPEPELPGLIEAADLEIFFDPKPSLKEIIDALADEFEVMPHTVAGWLLDLDTDDLLMIQTKL